MEHRELRGRTLADMQKEAPLACTRCSERCGVVDDYQRSARNAILTEILAVVLSTITRGRTQCNFDQKFDLVWWTFLIVVRFRSCVGIERHLVTVHSLVTLDLMAKAKSNADGGQCTRCSKASGFWGLLLA